MRHFDDATPIYLQIAEEIRAQILCGELVVDEVGKVFLQQPSEGER